MRFFGRVDLRGMGRGITMCGAEPCVNITRTLESPKTVDISVPSFMTVSKSTDWIRFRNGDEARK